jgi:DNA (cytosine-5)-methyltransferase 1
MTRASARQRDRLRGLATRTMVGRAATPRYTSVDLACGGGGSGIGQAMEGWDVKLGIDNNAQARSTFRRVHALARAVNEDLHNVANVCAHIRAAIPGRQDFQPDVISASRPCTPWTTATDLTAAHAAVARILVAVAKVIATIKPKAAVIENVPGAADSPEWREMCAILRRAGYTLEWTVVDAAKLGVPQRRRRLILVATLACPITHLVAAAAALESASDATIA